MFEEKTEFLISHHLSYCLKLHSPNRTSDGSTVVETVGRGSVSIKKGGQRRVKWMRTPPNMICHFTEVAHVYFHGLPEAILIN